jgi:hypothetical protein
MKLTYRDRGTSGTQLDVLSGTIVVCSLRKAMMSPEYRGERWGMDVAHLQGPAWLSASMAPPTLSRRRKWCLRTHGKRG